VRRKRQLEGTLRSDIGNTLVEIGSLDSAATQLQLALAARADAADRRGTAYTLNNMGRLQQTLGRPDSARRLFSCADDIFTAENDRVGRATALTNTGYSYERERRPADAVQWHRRALQALDGAGNPILEAVALNNLGRNFLLLDSLTAARDDVTAGLKAAQRVDDRWRTGWNLVDLGRIELALGKRDSAIALLSEGHTALAASDDPIREAEALLYLGRAYALPGPGQSFTAALDALAAANQVRQGVGRRVPRDADRVSFAEQDLALTDEWAMTTLAWGGQDPDKSARAALAVAEQGRARSLLLLMHGVDSATPGRNELPTIGQQLLSAIFTASP
jgi:tetratricopeptide (TPR) repeat protein